MRRAACMQHAVAGRACGMRMRLRMRWLRMRWMRMRPQREALRLPDGGRARAWPLSSPGSTSARSRGSAAAVQVATQSASDTAVERCSATRARSASVAAFMRSERAGLASRESA